MKARMKTSWMGAVAVLCLVGAANAGDWAKDVREDLQNPVRPGGVDGSPFWNENAILFMYPPAFDFKDLSPWAKSYEYEVLGSDGKLRSFRAPTPHASLAPVWADLPVGYVSVTCRGVDNVNLGHTRHSGSRIFWKSAPFTGNYPPAKRSYAEAVRMGLAHVLDDPSVRHLLANGEPDPAFKLNCYPTKMLSAIIRAMVRLAQVDPSRRDESLRAARAAADWLIAQAEPPSSPLADFPPTYRGKTAAAGVYGGQVMMIYPAAAARAYLALSDALGDGKYLAAAERIGRTYLRLQGEDGTWWLKMRAKDGTNVNENRLVPVDNVMPLLEQLFVRTKDQQYRRAAERAWANVEKTRVATWNWEGQFEDSPPSAAYVNLTKHGACSTAIYLAKCFADQPEKRALARDLLRFAEDQFVCWERPFHDDHPKSHPLQDLKSWRCPGVLEQYYWYVPIDASAAKMIRAYLALYRLEGRALDLAKAKALGDRIVNEQREDGLVPTHWDRQESANGIWMNCHIASILALGELVEFATGE